MPLYAKNILPKAHIDVGNQLNLDNRMKLHTAGHVKIHAKVMENRLKEIIKQNPVRNPGLVQQTSGQDS